MIRGVIEALLIGPGEPAPMDFDEEMVRQIVLSVGVVGLFILALVGIAYVLPPERFEEIEGMVLIGVLVGFVLVMGLVGLVLAWLGGRDSE